MNDFRSLIFGKSRIAMLLLALALMMRAVIPAGAMAGSEKGQITVSLCSEMNSAARTLTIDYERQDSGDHPATKQGPCAFLSLDMMAIGGADATLLAVAIAFILALGFTAIRQATPPSLAYLRPPLRGPPAAA